MKIGYRKNVTDEIVEYLKENIISGVWKPGDKISSEHELTKALQVSRASARYAIQHLVAIGVLESYQGKGTYVKSIPIEKIDNKFSVMYKNSEMQQLLEFRKLIEVGSCRIAANHITKNALAKMTKALETMKSSMNNSEIFIKNDIDFHMEILKATQNKLIINSIKFTEEDLLKQQYWSHTKQGVESAIYYHSEILEALKKGDGELSALKMNEHLSKAMNLQCD